MISSIELVLKIEEIWSVINNVTCYNLNLNELMCKLLYKDMENIESVKGCIRM
jgi:hypothetical protein